MTEDSISTGKIEETSNNCEKEIELIDPTTIQDFITTRKIEEASNNCENEIELIDPSTIREFITTRKNSIHEIRETQINYCKNLLSMDRELVVEHTNSLNKLDFKTLDADCVYVEMASISNMIRDSECAYINMSKYKTRNSESEYTGMSKSTNMIRYSECDTNKIRNSECEYISMTKSPNRIRISECEYIDMSTSSNTPMNYGEYITMGGKEFNTLKEHYFVQSKIREILSTVEEKSYHVPEFNKSISPMKPNRFSLAEYPLGIITPNINANYFYTSKLREEALHPGGVEIEITKLDTLGMRVVSTNDHLWIAQCPKGKSWKGQFHVGDRIVSINGEEIKEIKELRKLLRSSGKFDKITFRLKRLPHARIFAIKIDNFDSVNFSQEKLQTWILNNNEKVNIYNNDEMWFITEINGISEENSNQPESSSMKKPHQYISIIMHSKTFITNNLNIKLSPKAAKLPENPDTSNPSE